MIDKKDFNNCIIDILNQKHIENMPLDNIKTLKSVFSNKEINKLLYKGFKEDYNNIYGEDLDYFLMKAQDMVYRIHLLVNCSLYDRYGINDKNTINDVILKLLQNNSISFYDGVSYDDSDYEIIDNHDLEIKELLSVKKI